MLPIEFIGNNYASPNHKTSSQHCKKTFGIEKRSGTIQRPRRKLIMADPVKQNKWRKSIYPKIKKKQKKTMQ